MKAQKSPIGLDYFAVLQSHYDFIQPKREPKDLKKLFNSYELDIEFAHHEGEEGEIRVFAKIGINYLKKPVPGYKILTEGVAVFSFENRELPEKEQQNLRYYSSLSILIGYLRSSIAEMTSSSPYGPFLLPPVDINDLFRKKAELVEEENEGKTTISTPPIF
jgi:preprotein translocase subunit SecB